MNRLLSGSLASVLAVALLGAQDPPDPESGGEKPDRVNQRAQEMREHLGKQKPVKSHVRVQVRLKNGNRLHGVVKDGRLVERVQGLRFEDANAADKGAGIRLWYSGGTRNYVFVPFAELETYNVLQRLSAKELAEIEAEMQMREVEREEQLRKAQLARDEKAAAGTGDPVAAEPGGETVTGDDGEKDEKAENDGKTAKGTKGTKGAKDEAGPDAAALQETHQKWFALLQAYPPDAGWNASKRDEISRRFTVVGARPSAAEQRFVDEFADWERACAHFAAKPAATPKPADAAEEQTGRKSKRSGNKK